jgi:hypothetical protein
MATAVCDPLWGSTPIITFTASSSIASDGAAVGTPDFGSSCSRTSFEPHLGEIPANQQLVRKPDGQSRRQAHREPANRDLRRYGSPAAPWWTLNQAHLERSPGALARRQDRRVPGPRDDAQDLPNASSSPARALHGLVVGVLVLRSWTELWPSTFEVTQRPRGDGMTTAPTQVRLLRHLGRPQLPNASSSPASARSTVSSSACWYVFVVKCTEEWPSTLLVT